MMYIFRFILLISFYTVYVNADIQVIVMSAKNQNTLYKESKQLKQKVANLLSSDNDIRVVPSSHTIWKYRLAVTGIKSWQEAKKILNSARKIYPDAYMLKQKKSTAHSIEKTVEINFKNLSLKDFITFVAKATNKNILIPKKIDGKVDFVSTKPIREDQLLTMLNQTLLNNGYALNDSGNGYLKIVKSSDSIRNAPPMIGESDIDQMQTAVLSCKNVKPMDILKQAKALISKYGKISTANSNNAIIVTDYPKNIKSIQKIIDVLGQDATTVKYITFKNTDIESAYPEIKKMISSFFRKQSRNQQIQLVKNANANSIALVGDRGDISRILPYIKKLDMGSDQKEKDIELVYIKNADAESVSKILQGLISNKSFTKSIDNISSTQSNRRPLNGKSVKPEKRQIQKDESANILRTNEGPNITFDKQLNAIMVFGTKKERTVLKSIIQKLDVERKQVYVKARILEINNDKASEIGMQYGIIGGVSDSSGLYALSNKMGLDDAGAAINLANSINLDIPNVKKILALGAAVSLLSEKNAANIISEPSILCINNEESSIYVGKTISVVSQSSVGSTTTDINRNIYNREDIGLTLKIKPRISADSKVSLGVEISSEDILPGSMIGLPKTTKRVVKTSAIVKNGETIIVGGLVRDKESKNKTGIPIISNIPLFGKIFQFERTQHDKTTLLLMLTPYIVEQSADLTKLRYELGKLYMLEQKYAQKVEQKH